ncbi:MurR/RpiR family transcriptional regulator [Bacillus tianshenii]|nr:MurR/RpiR family transcriptional regulator [Bacillus tianshenii]
MLEQFVLDKIKHNQKNLTKAQKLVADYLLHNSEKVSYMTAVQIAQEVGVSETTVIRLAVSLGYQKFSQLQEEFRKELLNRRTLQRFKEASERAETDSILAQSFQQDVENLNLTLERIDEKEFEAAIDSICEASKVYTLGFRSSTTDAFYLGFTLNNLIGNVEPITTIGTAMDSCLKECDETNVIIIFSYPRYTSITVDAAKYLSEKGCKIIGITDSLQSPIIQYCKQVFFTSIESYTPSDSHVAGIALINAFLSAVGQKLPERVEEQLNELEGYFEKMKIFHNS